MAETGYAASPSAPIVGARGAPDAGDLVKQKIRRLESLKQGRSVFDAHWQEIRDFLAPLLQAIVTKETPGAKSHGQMLDSTGEQANELLAAGLYSLLTNPAFKWFHLTTQNPALAQREDVGLFLEEVDRRLYAAFNSPRAGFSPSMHETYIDLTGYGTGGSLYIHEIPGKGLRFAARPLAEMYLAEDNEGRINTWYRHFKLTAEQAVDEWGPRAGERVLKVARDNPDDKFDFLHATEPRRLRDVTSLSARHLPVASYWIGLADRHLIKEGGYHEEPYVTPRWMKRAGEVYGRGPGGKTLADIKMLNRTMRAQIRGVEKSIDPALLVVDDGVIGRIRHGSGEITHLRSGAWQKDPVRPMITGARPDIGEEFMAGIRVRIQSGFYNDLLRMLRDPRMTATQVLQIVEETLRILGPIIARLQSELIEPMIDRVFALKWRAGAFADLEIPAALQEGEELLIEHISPIARQQRLAEPRAILQTFDVMNPLMQLNPEIADNIDGDRTFRHVANLFGWPQSTLRMVEAMAKMRQARAEESNERKEMEQAALVAKAAGQAAPMVTALNPPAKAGKRIEAEAA